jgi:hypothetical protein
MAAKKAEGLDSHLRGGHLNLEKNPNFKFKVPNKKCFEF